MSSKRRLKRNGVAVNKARACFGKIKYQDKDAAEEAMGTLSKDPVFHGGRLNVYPCPMGGNHWHCGHVLHKKKVVKYAEA